MTRWQITFTPIDEAVPPAIRIRRLLKAALRAFGLRAIDVRLVEPKPSIPSPPGIL